MSTRKPFTEQKRCPVVLQDVIITGEIVSLGDAQAYANLNCSNIENCLKMVGDLQTVSECLFHQFKN